VLVQSNFGVMRSLSIAGAPVGQILEPEFSRADNAVRNAGSIICVVATDAPLLSFADQPLVQARCLGSVGSVLSQPTLRARS